MNGVVMLTPYAAHKLVNVELAKHNIKAIRPQMMYNYTSVKLNNGEKPLIKFDLTNGVDVEDLMKRWLPNYISKKIAAAAVEVEDVEQFEFDASEAH